MNENIIKLSPGDIVQVNGELHKIKTIVQIPYKIEDGDGVFASGYIPSIITMHTDYIYQYSPRASFIHDSDFMGDEKDYYKAHYFPKLYNNEKNEKRGWFKKIYNFIIKTIFNK